MKFVTKYKDHKKVSLTFTKPSKTDGSQKKECDINNIIKKYNKTGVLSHVSNAIPVFGDVSSFGDYQACIEHIQNAERLFSELPSRVRARFQNDPSQFLDFMSKQENIDEAVALGLATKRDAKSQSEPKVQDQDVTDSSTQDKK